jgi:hypothetical protein
VATGRDAADVAMTASFGHTDLTDLTVDTELLRERLRFRSLPTESPWQPEEDASPQNSALALLLFCSKMGA